MAMYFVQHGLALQKEVDPNRPLSPDGRREIERISTHLGNLGITVKNIYHSGKTRAKQTAQIFAEHIGDGNVHKYPGMNPNDSVSEFAINLNVNDTMYVGHLPHIGKLTSYLIAGDEEADVVTFTNGGVLSIVNDKLGYHIDWYLVPSMCNV
jgi:phosphohistidine phosphatase